MPRRQYHQVVKDLKPIYTASDVDSAQEALEQFDQKWGAQLPPVVKAWRENWEYVIPFMAFPPDVRRVVYTTDENVKGRRGPSGGFRRIDWSRSGLRGRQNGSCGIDLLAGWVRRPVSRAR
ncbi:MAG: transposase, partial [Solirubrobacterales bacterium]|nr:transposase [Solirubrobacterales bacterium]